ncbi:MAG: hypothetical protein EXR30_05855 [Betaproteobacteria bacterium]|nr:hypothetical protein [Betaproteobacteria bacterium]MSQ89205.1 hypothetical protein [Betaproteobacteria bacterium]
MSDEPTMKLVTNLDRTAIEAKLREIGGDAADAGLTELARMFIGIEGMPAAQIEQRVTNAIKWLANKPQHMKISAVLDLVGMNLKNLK